jgi:POT family proton-dependent oligopeptide transporter
MGAIARLKEHPRGFWFVFSGELAERSSYYGMRTLLALYLVDVIGFEKHSGAKIVHLFMAGCYLLTLPGGFIADRWLGRYKTIVYFSIPYIFGHIVLGAWHNPITIYLALFLLATGSGTIKPSCSPLMGMIYEKENKAALLPEAFSYYYLAINIGSVMSNWALPNVRDYFMPASGWTPATLSTGYQVALAFPTLLMVIALLVFAYGKKYYPVEQVTKRPPKTEEQKKAEWATLLRIGGVFIIIIFWWFIYDMQADIWIYFTRDHVNLNLWPFSVVLKPEMQWVNPAFIIGFTPIFNWHWNAMQKRRGGVAVPTTQKMLLGFILTLLTCCVLTFAAFSASGGAKISVWWMLLALALITYAELAISMLGLLFAYEQALPGTKSFVTALFLLTIFVADTGGAFFADYYEHPLSPTTFFGLQIGLMALCTVIFYFVARRFERQSADLPPSVPAAA